MAQRPSKNTPVTMDKERFKLERSKDRPKWWVLTDTENLVVLKFREHEFETSQEITLLNEDEMMKEPDCANKLAKIFAEMGDWMAENHLSLAVPMPVFEVESNENGCKEYLLRNSFPRFSLHIEDECSNKELAKALRSAAEYLLKREGRV